MKEKDCPSSLLTRASATWAARTATSSFESGANATGYKAAQLQGEARRFAEKHDDG
jgi:hypothetical protein